VTSLDVFEAAARRPDALAVVAGSTQLSFAALAERVELASRRLSGRGLLTPRPEPVALVARPSLPSLELVYALISAGVPILFVHARLPASERAALARRAGARALLEPDVTPLSGPASAVAVRAPLAPDLPLAIIPTSGSSGEPKLVVLSRGAFTASAQASQHNLALSVEDRWLLCLPLAHVGGLSIVTRGLVTSSAVVTFEPANGSLLNSVGELAERLASQAISVVSLVPAVLAALLRERPEWRPPSSLRAVLVGGAALSPTLLERARERGVPLLTTYGLTEACSQVTTTRVGTVPRVEGSIVSSGWALPGIELSLDADSRIRVRGPTLLSHLLDASSPLDEDGWLTTEDRGVLAEDGELFVLGRTGDVIITGGEKVDPLRVEAVLGTLPGVRAAAVFGRPDPTFGHIVAAAIVADPDFNEVTSYRRLYERLASHERPRALVKLDELPVLANGKLNRRALTALVADRLEPWTLP
jgi:O-succinylbenzoic acid--CoA ligase